MTFETLGLAEGLVRALKEDGITNPTNIQEQSIPKILEGKDVVGISYTGSGKTAAFGAPCIQIAQKGQGVQVLILTPTRELAVQISKNMQRWSRYEKRFIATVFGGVALAPQVDEMARAEIIVATPGRILDHLERGTVDLMGLKLFCLDEADKMVEMGFIEDVDRILSYAPERNQILLFGATISKEIRYLKDRHMHDSVEVKAQAQVREDFLEQFYFDIKPWEKFSLLVHLLKTEKTNRVIVFCSSRATVEIVSKNLSKHGFRADMLHGKLSQNRRLRVIDKFNKTDNTILVASAVAARGLHIENVSHVLNYDLSRDPQEYIHRVGRTARAGEKGKAFTLLTNRDHEVFQAVLQRYPITVKKLEIPTTLKKLRFETAQRREQRSFGRDRGRGASLGYGNRESYGERAPHREKHRRRDVEVSTSKFNRP